MFGLPVSLTAQLLIVGALLLGTNAVTAIKVASYVRTGYENVTLKENIRVVERERRVEVLDKKTLEEAITRERSRSVQELENERLVNAILQQHAANPAVLWCELSPDELRVWNDENAGKLLDDDSHTKLERGKELSKPPGK